MAELVHTPQWRAFDGRLFPTQAEADAHEAENFDLALVNLTPERVRAAMAYEAGERSLAEAIERVAYQIAVARKALGFYKRRPNGEPDATATRAAPESDDRAADPAAAAKQDEAA